MKVKVRIAVAVGSTGDWHASGSNGTTDADAMSFAVEFLDQGERRYWIEAELDTPDVMTIAGTVTEHARVADPS